MLRVSNRTRVFGPALKACIEADPHFPKVTLRKLRNTAASLAIAEGATVKAVQALLGQKSVAMTLDIYASLFASDLDDVADNLNTAGSPRTPGEDLRQMRGRIDVLADQLVELRAAPRGSGNHGRGVNTDGAIEALRCANPCRRCGPIVPSLLLMCCALALPCCRTFDGTRSYRSGFCIHPRVLGWLMCAPFRRVVRQGVRGGLGWVVCGTGSGSAAM